MGSVWFGFRAWEELGAASYSVRRGIFKDLILFGAIKMLFLQDRAN